MAELTEPPAAPESPKPPPVTLPLPSPWQDRHPSVAHFEQAFRYTHLRPGVTRSTSRQFTLMAEWMLSWLNDGPELAAGLRKLREAKDCAVLQAVIDESTRGVVK